LRIVEVVGGSVLVLRTVVVRALLVFAICALLVVARVGVYVRGWMVRCVMVNMLSGWLMLYRLLLTEKKEK
jgi:hypothetical protein